MSQKPLAINSRGIGPYVFRLDEVFVVFLPDFINRDDVRPRILKIIFIQEVVFAVHLRLMQQPQQAGWKLNDNYKRRLK